MGKEPTSGVTSGLSSPAGAGPPLPTPLALCTDLFPVGVPPSAKARFSTGGGWGLRLRLLTNGFRFFRCLVKVDPPPGRQRARELVAQNLGSTQARK